MKRTKKVTSALKAIAKGMPKVKYQYAGKLIEEGSDLIQRGITQDEANLPIMPHNQYIKKILLENEVNHINRMKSAWDSGGLEGVKRYLKPFVKPEMQNDFFDRLQKTLQ